MSLCSFPINWGDINKESEQQQQRQNNALNNSNHNNINIGEVSKETYDTGMITNEESDIIVTTSEWFIEEDALIFPLAVSHAYLMNTRTIY